MPVAACSSCSEYTSRLSMYFMPSTAASAAGDGGEGGHPGQQRRGADVARVGDRVAALFHGVDHQRDLVVLDHVHDVRAAFRDLVDRRAPATPAALMAAAVPLVATSSKPSSTPAHAPLPTARGLSLFLTVDAGPCPTRGRLGAGAQLALRRRLRRRSCPRPSTSPVDFISGAEDGVHARELDEREHGFLDAEVRRHHFRG